MVQAAQFCFVMSGWFKAVEATTASQSNALKCDVQETMEKVKNSEAVVATAATVTTAATVAHTRAKLASATADWWASRS